MNSNIFDGEFFPASFTGLARGLGLGGAGSRIVTVSRVNPADLTDDRWVIYSGMPGNGWKRVSRQVLTRDRTFIPESETGDSHPIFTLEEARAILRKA